MGFDAQILVWNEALYRERVVPAWERLLHGEGLDLWLRARMKEKRWDTRFFESGTWLELYRARSSDPQHQACWRVEARGLCVDEGQFLGRSFDAYGFNNFLEEKMGLPYGEHPLFAAFTHLGYRGWELCEACIEHREVEGVTGWLEPDETRQFARSLDTLDLPRYEPSFTAMLKAHMASRSWAWEGAEADTHWNNWVRLSLSFLRTVATIAGERGHGVLWSNDSPRETLRLY